MNQRIKGIICGIMAAICYGTNPLGALFLYQEGVNTSTVLAHRFGIAAILLVIVLLIRKESLRVSQRELKILSALGVLFAMSSLSLFYSFKFMDAGVASTILFVYPVMVALIMTIFFKERPSLQTATAIILALSGIILLYRGDGETSLSTIGVILVLISSLTYAIYIVIQDRTKIQMSPFKTNLYVALFCLIGIVIQSFIAPDAHLHALPSMRAVGFTLFLAFVPTISALVLLTISCRYIGSTPTAIMGALEPLTAVCIGILIFGESFTWRLAVGITLILAAVILIALSKEKATEKKR